MYSKVVLIVLGTFCAQLSSLNAACDESKCADFGLGHYKEMGCTPIKDSDGCCAIKYDCPAYAKMLQNPDKCFLKGKAYADRESVPNEETDPVCSASCSCNKNWPSGPLPTFTCAQIECPDLFGHYPPPGCYFKYDVNICCSTETYCPSTGKDAKEPGKSCERDGTTYRDGDRADRDCESCVCKNGEFECRPLDCGIELREGPVLARGGAPVYYGRQKCNCPISVIEPERKVEIIPGGSTQSDLVCKFGDKELKLGDIMKPENENKCVSCKCEVPPNVSCFQDPDCRY